MLAAWSAFVLTAYAAVGNRYGAYALCLGALIFSGYKALTGGMSWAGNWPLFGVMRWSDLGFFENDRQALVLNPTVGGAVTKVYSWFGVTLVPRWDLSAYAVKQLGAVAEGADGTRLRVRLSVQNTSTRVQPLPLVRLTLKDRYANPVATRDLEPDEYLPARAIGQRLLEPDQRIDAELQVADPGRAAIGFEIDACLRAENGAIGCASDAKKLPAG